MLRPNIRQVMESSDGKQLESTPSCIRGGKKKKVLSSSTEQQALWHQIICSLQSIKINCFGPIG